MRLRKYFGLFILSVILCATFLSGPAFAAQKSSTVAAVKKVESPKIVVVSIPRVSWKTLEEAKTPNIDNLVNIGSSASLSTKTAQKTANLESSYATISSGTRATAGSSHVSTFFKVDELVGSSNAGDIFKKERGISPREDSIVGVGFEKTLVKNKTGLNPASIGSFASALEKNDKTISVFGNADNCQKFIPSCFQRSIGYFGVNKDGIVNGGDVSRDILNDNLEVDMSKVEVLAQRAIEQRDVTVVECSNLEKLEQFKKTYSAEVFEQSFLGELEACDDLIGNLVDGLNLNTDRIYVISPIPSLSQPELTVFINAGGGIEPGRASSGVTRREGIVALEDLAPSMLNFLSIDPPEEMVATLIENSSSSNTGSERIQNHIGVNERALVRDDSFGLVATVFGLLAFASVLVSLFSYFKMPNSKILRLISKFLSLVVLAIPSCTLFIFPFMLSLGHPVFVLFGLLFISSVLSAIGYYFGERKSYVYVVLAFASLNVASLAIDVLTGAQLQRDSLFGNSTIVAGRFAGFGNLSFSILSISSVVFVACIKHLADEHPNWNRKWLHASLIAFLIAVLVLDGAPFFGSDVGGVLALTPTVFVISMMLYEKRLDVKAVFVAALLTLFSIGIFSIVDLNRPVSERTHLGRFIEVLFNGQAGVVIERKISSNLLILTNSTISSVVLIGTFFAMFLFFKPEKAVRSLVEKYTFFRYLVLPSIVLASLGMLLNDSGVAIPGMMMTIIFPMCALLLFEFKAQSQSNTTLESNKV